MSDTAAERRAPGCATAYLGVFPVLLRVIRSDMSASGKHASGVLQIHSVACKEVRTVVGCNRKQSRQAQEHREGNFNTWS